jgi:biotin carboxyl carrier protein
MEFEFLIDGELKTLSLEKKGEKFFFQDGDRNMEADILPISPNAMSMIVDGGSHTIHFARDRETLQLFLEGRLYTVQEVASEGAAAAAGRGKSREDMLKVSAPMPGKVIKISVEEGSAVSEKQTLVIVEAMKMENEVKAELDCRVKKICCAAGDLVDVTTILIELEDTGADSS